MAATVLDREMYTEAQAARLLDVAHSTLHYWLEGGQSRGKQYAPILREAPRGDRIVTWGEFVEAGLLREYRRTHRVPMVELRTFVERLRQEFGVPYPLADRRPYVTGRQLLYKAQDEVGLAADFQLVTVIGHQHVLLPPSDAFMKRVEWEGDFAAEWRPDSNERSTVRINPSLRFGEPSVGGISTATIWEEAAAGEDFAHIADVFQLTLADVRFAMSYELSTHAA